MVTLMKKFINQPKDFERKNKPDHMFFLKESLYKLKWSPCQYYKKVDSYVLSIGFKMNDFDHCLYYLHHNTNKQCMYFFLIYMDNMLLIRPNMKVVNKIRIELNKEFK